MVVSSRFSSERPLHPEKTPHEGSGEKSLQKPAHSTPIYLTPLSFPYIDPQGRILQLWKCGSNLIAAMINTDSTLKVFSGKKIHNALLPQETDDTLLSRIEVIKVFQLLFLKNIFYKIFV